MPPISICPLGASIRGGIDARSRTLEDDAPTRIASETPSSGLPTPRIASETPSSGHGIPPGANSTVGTAQTRSYTRRMLSPGSTAPHAQAARILIVDDDPTLRYLLADQLRDDGYEVATARDGMEAIRRLEGGWPDLLIVDMMMPKMDGLTLAREIKNRADLPIIVLSAIDAGDSKADLLDEVAEDYVTKPYHYPELRARINRVLRRLGDRVPRQRLVLGSDLALELHRREAIVSGKPVALTPTESRLLYALAANLGRTVTTETLLARGWAETEDADPSYVWVTMRRLRQKIEVDPNHPRHVLTMRGVGYRLVGTGATSASNTDTDAGDDAAADQKRMPGSSAVAGP
jgi:DNA-binding response OmpR family regulator